MYNIDEIKNKIICGDCLEVMKLIPDNSVDSIVTDPPYELGFMGKSWDSTGIANSIELWRQCLRVLKPGGYLLSFSATRTYHRMASAIEDAGFEIRDMIEWVYGSGFPKSLNIGKAVDKIQGNDREILATETRYNEPSGIVGVGQGERTLIDRKITKGTSEWEGWGTALKPAHEPICMARKPISEKTVAENCLKWGTGGINIDKSRVESKPRLTGTLNKGDEIKAEPTSFKGSGTRKLQTGYDEKMAESNLGRFPVNLIHDGSDEVVACFPNSKSTRFFKSILYYPKASKSERNKGCEGPVKNNHPTVKPLKLMEYLCILTKTPTGGIVLDPFAGSGTTCMAAKKVGRDFIGIEKEPDYVAIAEARIKSIPESLF